MFKIDLNKFLQFVRIAMFNIGGGLAAHGIAVEPNMKVMVTGIALTVATYIWTAYATRIAAKINEIVGSGLVEVIVTKDSALADNAQSNKVIALSDVTDQNVKTETDRIVLTPKT